MSSFFTIFADAAIMKNQVWVSLPPKCKKYRFQFIVGFYLGLDLAQVHL